MDNTQMIISDFEERLLQLEEEHKALRFELFDSDTALSIGLFILEKAKEGKLPLAVDICCGRQQLFHCALKGTSEENDRWIIRKNRVALKFGKSSYYIRLLLKSKNATIEEYYKISETDYAAYGGAFPVMDIVGSVIGTITVSGLPDYKDHELVVEAIQWYLNKKKEA